MNLWELWPIIATVASGITLLISALVGFIVKGSLQAMRDLRADHNNVRNDISAVRELLAGKFIQRDEAELRLQRMKDDIMGRVQHLEARILELERVATFVRRTGDRGD